MRTAHGQSVETAVTPFLLSEHGCGRSTGYAETNKIVTLGDKTHVAWLDSTGGTFPVRVRTLDRRTGTWGATVTVGEAYDNHGGPALTADSEGHLHIVYYPHHHPFRYRRSLRPNDATAWGEELQFGGRCTYPTLLTAPDNALILTCRESHQKGEPWVVNLYRKPPDGPWGAPHTIMVADEPGYSHFQEALAWAPDHRTIHLSTRMYGGKPGRAHTVGYMRSPDAGATWLDAAGRPLELPVTSDTITRLDDDREGPTRGFRCGAVAVAPDGAPLVLYSDTSHDPSNAWLCKLLPDGTWARHSLLEPVRAIMPDAEIAMPGGLCVTADRRIHVVLTAAVGGSDVGWGTAASEVVRLVGAPDGGAFRAHRLSPGDPGTPFWLPNMEHPTGHHSVMSPGVIFQGGGPGSKNTDMVNNRVYWVG